MRHQGALVRQVSTQELGGLFQARLLLEGSAMELICRERIAISPKIAANLERMRNMKDVATPADQLDFIGLGWSLHDSELIIRIPAWRS